MSQRQAPNLEALESSYTDEFGSIAPDVYASAIRLLPRGQNYIGRTSIGGDAARARTLLLKAAAQVTRARTRNALEIREIEGYLFQTFKRIVGDELEKESNRLRFETEACLDAAREKQFAGRLWLQTNLSGASAVTGNLEFVNVYMTQENDLIFYFVSVSPLAEYGFYQRAFETVLQSVRFK